MHEHARTVGRELDFVEVLDLEATDLDAAAAPEHPQAFTLRSEQRSTVGGDRGQPFALRER